MSFENPAEKIKWPRPGSVPEDGTDVRYTAVAGSKAKRPDAWVTMGVTQEGGVTMVEIWHGYKKDEFKKLKVPLEELRALNQKA